MGAHSRRRPDIQAYNEYIPREMYPLCQGSGCRNVIAVWTNNKLCSKCRRREKR